MSKFEVKFIIDRIEVSQEEIKKVELQRYKKVLSDLFEHGVTPTLNGIGLSSKFINTIELEKAREVLAETKEKLGRKGIYNLYKKELEESDRMWCKIAANSRTRENLQSGIVEVEVKGLTLQQFSAFNHSIDALNSLALPSRIHPEHYSFESFPGGQIIIETFGMYKNPSYLKLEILKSEEGFMPITPDSDTAMVMMGTTKLMSDDTDTKIIGMHQFKSYEDGMKIKLGVFLPEAAPREIVEGHKWHLAVEFNNALHLAAEMAKIK